MISPFLKLTSVFASAAAAIITHSAENSAVATIEAKAVPADFSTAGLQLWLSANQVEQTGGVITQIAGSSSLPEGWVLIKSKGQSFRMGQEFPGRRWTYTFPVHQVSFTYDFMMAATQVTQADYKRVAGVNPTKHPGDEHRPIDNVSWFDAVLYCNSLSKRDGLEAVYGYSRVTRNLTNNEVVDLPELTIDIKKNGYRLLTSAEYEYVVRAGTTTTWFFGDSNADQTLAINYAWCDLNAKDKATHPVGKLKPNAFGVYDSTGNLWMWCNDWYDGPYPETPQVDPTGPTSGKEQIGRGAAFKNDVNHQRSAYHWQWPPQAHNFELGFRVARTVR